MKQIIFFSFALSFYFLLPVRGAKDKGSQDVQEDQEDFREELISNVTRINQWHKSCPRETYMEDCNQTPCVRVRPYGDCDYACKKFFGNQYKVEPYGRPMCAGRMMRCQTDADNQNTKRTKYTVQCCRYCKRYKHQEEQHNDANRPDPLPGINIPGK